MTSILIGFIAVVFGGVILNFASAGMTAGLYFWRGMRNTSKRALLGSLLTSGLVLAMMAGGFLQGAMLGVEGGLAFIVGALMMGAIGFATSLPGAFIMSRKIAKTDFVGETFR